MRRFSSLFFSILLLAGAFAGAQVVHTATGRQVSITAGGMASGFQPDFIGNYDSNGFIAQSSNQPLFGAGAYVDVRLRRWVQFEAEGRWLRWNAFQGITQDNYLIGPRLPVYRFWKSTVYGKALGGFSKMNFGPYFGNQSGQYTDFAFGGGMDIRLTKRISLRAADVEYHYWPWWGGNGNTKLSPYGASVGIGYKIF
jgi:hypothetical protein